MTWDEMDADDKTEVIWRMTHDGYIVREIAAELETTPRTVVLFANKAGLIIRHRLPAYGRQFLSSGKKLKDPVAGAATKVSCEDRHSNSEAVH